MNARGSLKCTSSRRNRCPVLSACLKVCQCLVSRKKILSLCHQAVLTPSPLANAGATTRCIRREATENRSRSSRTRAYEACGGAQEADGGHLCGAAATGRRAQEADGREGLPAKSGYGETAQGSFGTFSSLVHSQLAYPTRMLKSLSCGLAFEWPRLLAGVDESPFSRLGLLRRPLYAFFCSSTASASVRRPRQGWRQSLRRRPRHAENSPNSPPKGPVLLPRETYSRFCGAEPGHERARGGDGREAPQTGRQEDGL